MPFRRAFVAASWMTGPSAIGSLKGMPISNMSMPRAANVRMMSAVLPAVGCPAQKYKERIFCFFSLNSLLILFIIYCILVL